MMKKTILAICLLLGSIIAEAQESPIFPLVEGRKLHYERYDAEGEFEASCIMLIGKVTGDFKNGKLTIKYYCHDKKGKPFFDGANEFILHIDRTDGNTHITMDKMSKTLKAMDLIAAGDVSALTLPMTVGQNLPDSYIASTLGRFKASLHISNKKVNARKTITVNGKQLDCWQIHEEIETKTPFGRNYEKADTWYAEGAGCVSQNIYDSKGKLKGRIELTAID